MATEILIFEITFLCFCGFMLIKNNRTYKMRMLVNKALWDYNKKQIENERFEDMICPVFETYAKTLWRLWDWGYKNIVPSDVLEKIEPYIGREETTQ